MQAFNMSICSMGPCCTLAFMLQDFYVAWLLASLKRSGAKLPMWCPAQSTGEVSVPLVRSTSPCNKWLSLLCTVVCTLPCFVTVRPFTWQQYQLCVSNLGLQPVYSWEPYWGVVRCFDLLSVFVFLIPRWAQGFCTASSAAVMFWLWVNDIREYV